MAKLVLSLREFCDLIQSQFPQNRNLDFIEILQQNKDILITFKIKLLPPVSIKLIFSQYEKSWVFFRIEGKKWVNILLDLIKTQPAPWLKVNQKNLMLEVNQLLNRKIPGIKIDRLVQDDEGNFVFDFNIDEFFT